MLYISIVLDPQLGHATHIFWIITRGVETAIVGNPTVDIIITKDGVYRRLGGPIYYASLVFGALGVKAKAVGVASAEVVKEIRNLLSKLNIEAQLEEADVATTFELDYTTKPRSVRLVAKPAKKIRHVSGDIVILSPVYDELAGVEVEADKVVVDLQGFIRARLPFPDADIVHLSYDDMQITPRELVRMGERWPIVVYTLGEDGAFLVKGGEVYYINSAKLNVPDTTGSGDVFLAALTYFYFYKKLDILEAVCEASKIVAGFLLTKTITKHEFSCIKQVVQV